jgi:hypothetical protein
VYEERRVLTGMQEKDYARSIDVRKASIDALSRIMGCLGVHIAGMFLYNYSANLDGIVRTELESNTSRDVLQILVNELDDYSVDQRGDVGSWVRMSCVSGLVGISKVLLDAFPSPSELERYLPPELFHIAIGGILKQGVERLDNVRQLVGETLVGMVSTSNVLKSELSSWRLYGMEILRPLCTVYVLFGYLHSDKLKRLREQGDHEWREASWLYPRAVGLLVVPQYRHRLLLGLILSIGSRTTSTVSDHRAMIRFFRR